MDSSADGKLIHLISNCKELYDKNNEHFKNVEWKERVWREICEKLPVDVEDVELVKKRWKNLRDTYLKRKKELLKNGTENRNPLREWKHLNSMGFLDPYLSYYPKETSIYSVSVDEDAVEVYCEMEDEQESTCDEETTKETVQLSKGMTFSTPNTSRVQNSINPSNSTLGLKRKPLATFSEEKKESSNSFNYKKSRKQPKKTPDEFFALSLVPALERMSQQQNALAKVQIQQVLYDIEFGNKTGE